MVWAVVSLACITAFALGACYEALRMIGTERRQSARERDLLLNQIMHLSGRTWTPPPSEVKYENPAPELSYDYSSSIAMPDLYGDAE